MLDASDLFRPLLWFARALWWLGYEFMVQTVGWSIGWVIWRLVTFGRFPETGIREQDETVLWASILVELTGLAALAGAIWWLSRHVPMW